MRFMRTVIVTGASSGIGEAAVRRLHAAGCNVVLCARREERLRQIAREIDPTAERTAVAVADLTQDSDRSRVVEMALSRFGEIYGLVNNAGYGQRGALEQVPLDLIRRNFETNVFSLIALTQLVIPSMRAKGEGRIVNVGSVAGRIARPLTAVYDSTKHAVEAVTDGFRGELKPFGINVSLVRPGFIATEFVEAADRASQQVIAEPGPYGRYAQSLSGSARKLIKIAGSSDQVARVIEHAVCAARPRTHYAVPRHAKFFLFLKWAMPVRALDWAVRLRE
jgi:short-subunit dehydrogenase